MDAHLDFKKEDKPADQKYDVENKHKHEETILEVTLLVKGFQSSVECITFILFDL